jgi:hypothetical protein
MPVLRLFTDERKNRRRSNERTRRRDPGVAEINERHPGDYLDFRDRFAFIRGVRP